MSDSTPLHRQSAPRYGVQCCVWKGKDGHYGYRWLGSTRWVGQYGYRRAEDAAKAGRDDVEGRGLACEVVCG